MGFAIWGLTHVQGLEFMGFEPEGSGFGVWGLGFGIWRLGLRARPTAAGSTPDAGLGLIVSVSEELPFGVWALKSGG